MATGSVQQEESFEDAFKTFVLHWTPRVIVVTLSGYYGLGVAYEYGWMASIDQVAIPLIKRFGGYTLVGASMPTFQWYAAWAVRITIGVCCGVIYDLAEKGAVYCYQRCAQVFKKSIPPAESQDLKQG